MYSVLEKIKNPSEIKKMSPEKRIRLAEEIRVRIAEIVEINGGHLGPNLGAVEIIIACHMVFELNKDRLVFDVGHQSYPHKLLTDRNKLFETLRQKGGISGYPHQGESDFDVFRGGHASTAISTALGLQTAFSMNNATKKYRAIALVGDGSMTGGMSFEGLNHAGHMKKNLIVILNDNSMSISPTIGGMANTFNEFRHGKLYNQFREGLINNLKKIPKVGSKIENIINFCLEEVKTLVNPGQIFTILGFDYYGPLNGNDIQEVARALESAKNCKDKPVIIHAITEKGKDYMPKGKNGEKIIGPHALSPMNKIDINKNSNKNIIIKKPKKISYSKAFTEIISKLCEINIDVFAVTAAMSEGTGLNVFGKYFPDKFIDVGICEGHAVGFCAGLSSGKKKPIFAVYSTFLQRGFDQLFHDVVLQDNLFIMLCIDRAGLVGEDGPSHHGIYDIAFLRILPKFILMAPKDRDELETMMKLGIEQDNPVAIRYPRDFIPNNDAYNNYNILKEIKIGKAELLKQGQGVALFSYGFMTSIAAQVEKEFALKKIQISLVNARFAKPLDKKMLKKINLDHHTIIILEEGTVIGGLGSAVLEACNEMGIDSKKIICIGIPDRLIEHASRDEQLAECGLDKKSIINLVNSRLRKKK